VNEKELLIEYFKYHKANRNAHYQIVKNMGFYDKESFVEGMNRAYEHIIDILIEDDLRAKELGKINEKIIKENEQ
jgi:hypothetical protein